MPSIAEYVQAFHKYAYEHALNANVRALYFSLIGEFNRAYWPEELSKSVRELCEIGGFSSVSTVHRAKAVLGTENIIKIRKTKTSDIYVLIEPEKWLRNSRGTVSGTAPEHERNTSAENAHQDTCAKDGKDNKDRLKKEEENAGAYLDELDDLVWQEWINANGENPNRGDSLDLKELSKKFGSAKVAESIVHCRRNRQSERVTIRYVEAVLRGEKFGKNSGTGGLAEYVGYHWDKAEMPPE